jgi:hypothetical protein
MPRAKKLNREDLTPAKLRQFEGFEQATDEEAKMICEFTIEFCSIIHEMHEYNKKRKSYEKCTKRF